MAQPANAMPRNSTPARQIAISLPLTGEEEWHATREPLMSGWLTQGPKVAEFEKQFAARHQAAHALAVTSCTTGLHLALAALDIQPGDEVIVPAFTWVSTANVVEYCGAKPVFVDIDLVSFNIDVTQVKSKVSARTKAIIPVHLFGLCADIDALRAELPTHVKILEDCACAAGANLRGKPAGTLGDMGVFSFHPRKSITTGEGGMVTTNNAELAERMNQRRNHGAGISEEQRHRGPRPYLLPEFDVLGFNYRMTDLQGAVGIVQLKKLDTMIDERNDYANYYSEKLANIPWLRLPKALPQSRHGWQAYVTYVDPELAPMPRNDMMEKLQALGIATRPGTHAVHMLGYYREKYGITAEDYPNAMRANNHSMAIPLHNRMNPDDFDYIIDALKSF
jgi:perosamine synthetase